MKDVKKRDSIRRMRKERYDRRHERNARRKEERVFRQVPALRPPYRMRNEVVEYHDKVRPDGKSEEGDFERFEPLQQEIRAERADEDGARRDEITDERRAHRKARLPENEKFGDLLQELMHHDAQCARDPEKRRGGERNDDNYAVTDIMDAVAHEHAIGVDLRMGRLVRVVVMVELRDVSERYEDDDRPDSDPRQTLRQRAGVLDNLP